MLRRVRRVNPVLLPALPACFIVVIVFLQFAPSASAQALRGTVEKKSFVGPVTRRPIEFSIYLPGSYSAGNTRYPVLYHLHGLGGSHGSQQTRTVSAGLEKAQQEGLIGPLIIVFPDGYKDSFWADSRDMMKPAETNVVREIMPYVDENFRTIGDPRFRAVQGFSMGGFGAAKFLAKFPDLFSACIVYDGALLTWRALRSSQPAIAASVFGDDESYFNSFSPWAQSEKNQKRLRRWTRFRHVVGALTAMNREFGEHLNRLDIPLEYVETPCAHDLGCLLDLEGNKSASFLSFAFVTISPAAEDYLAGWDFNEGQGLVARDRGRFHYDGRVAGASWAKGILGSSLSFTGSEFVEIEGETGHPEGIGDLKQGTISLWLRFGRVPGENEILPVFYLGDGIGGPGNSSLIIEIGHFNRGNTKLYFTVLDDDRRIPLCFDSAVNLAPYVWYHFAAVVGPGFNTGYINGVEMAGRHYNFGRPSSQHFFADVADKRVCWIGRGFLGDVAREQFYTGEIDEVRVYDRPLSGAEVAAYYRAVLSRKSGLPYRPEDWKPESKGPDDRRKDPAQIRDDP